MANPEHRHSFHKIGIALLGIWLAIVVYCVLYHLAGALTVFNFPFRPWPMIKGATLYVWAPWLLLAPLVYFFASQFPIRPDHRLKSLLQHFVLMSLLALVHAFGAAMLYYTIGYFDVGMENYAAWQHTGHYLFIHNNFYLIDGFVYCVLIASISLRHYYEEARQKELDVQLSQTQLVESRLQTLKMQVNPHFLFNTLNSIAVMIRKQDNAGAKQMLSKLSDFFRLTLEQGKEQLVRVDEELRLIRKYLEIESIRFGDRLEVSYQIEENCLERHIPVLLLQPLVENAIKHGLGKTTGKCNLQIRISDSLNGLSLNVIDNGAGVQCTGESENRSGVGLNIIKSRLAALYAERAQFSFSSEPGKGASVNIFLPTRGDTAPV